MQHDGQRYLQAPPSTSEQFKACFTIIHHYVSREHQEHSILEPGSNRVFLTLLTLHKLQCHIIVNQVLDYNISSIIVNQVLDYNISSAVIAIILSESPEKILSYGIFSSIFRFWQFSDITYLPFSGQLPILVQSQLHSCLYVCSQCYLSLPLTCCRPGYPLIVVITATQLLCVFSVLSLSLSLSLTYCRPGYLLIVCWVTFTSHQEPD